MLEACARYQYMTVEQWVPCSRIEGKRRYLQRRSQELADHDYLIRLYITPLGWQGQRAVTSSRMGPPAGTMPSPSANACRTLPADRCDKKLTPAHLAHSEDITDVLLSFDLLARHDDADRGHGDAA